MNKDYEKLLRCTEYVKSRIDGFKPKIALILGSGLNGYGEIVKPHTIIDYSEIEGFPVSTVAGHVGRFIFGWVEDVPVVVMQGRVHYYEGYSMPDVCLPTRLMGLLGAEVLFITNGAGALNRDYRPGDLMLMRDHLSLFIPSPLIGPNMDELGPRFPDMTTCYREDLRKVIRQSALELGINLREGVYVMLTGPQYETPEEVRLLEYLGGDVVGMSSVTEALAGNHMGLKICGLTSVGNMGAGITGEKLEHGAHAGEVVDDKFARLVTRSIVNIAKTL